MTCLFIILLGLISLGAAVSLIALLRPLRRMAERSTEALINTAVVLGLISFSIGHAGAARLGAWGNWFTVADLTIVISPLIS
ncbi:MAG: hypothetical protein PVH78_05860 [Deltaproteobacteria bacterium]|jgi:hypothetical protein